ncbi:MAG: BREX system ATP-binding domain-containing protein [Candidatus Saliniplasma sp.]
MFPLDARSRTFLHLKNYQKYRNQIEVPYQITQPGIADEIDISRGYLTQVINDMREEGLVVEKVRHVQDASRRRKVYFLSPSGLQKEEEIRKSLESELVELKTKDGSKEVRLGNIGKHIDKEMGLLDAVISVDSNDVLDLTKSKKKEDVLVGREKELQILKKELEKVKEGANSTIFICGDTGIGKTRLAKELKPYALEQGFKFLSGKSHFETSDPYLPFKRAFRKHFEEMEEIPDFGFQLGMAGVKKVKAETKNAFEAQRKASFFEAAQQLRDFLEDSPLVLFLDDLQWADKASLQLFYYLVMNLTDSRILLLASFRPEDIHEDHFLREIRQRLIHERRAKFIELDPLNKSGTEGLAKVILNVDEIPTSFVDLLYDISDGNPLYIKEYLTAFVDEKSIEPTRNEYPMKESEIQLPHLVQGVIKRKMDSLPPEALRLLELGSVIGDEIPFELLLSTSRLNELDLLDQIDVLLDTNLWDEGGDGERLYFNHRSVQLAAYRGAPLLKRKKLHSIVAENIEDIYQNNLEMQYSNLAYHYERAGKTDEAVSYYMKAGEYAENVYAHEDAIEMYERCLDLLDEKEGHTNRSYILEHLGDVNKILGRYEESRDYYHKCIDYCEDEVDLPNLYQKIADTWLKQGDFDKTLEFIERGLSVVGSETHERCKLLNVKGWANMQAGENEKALNVFDESRKLADKINSKVDLGESLHNLGTVYIRTGNYKAGLDNLRQAAEIREDAGDKEGLARSLNNLGIIYEDKGDLDKSLEYYQKSLEIQEEIGMKDAIATVYINMGILQGIRGQNQEAEGYFEKSLDMFKRIGDKRGIALSLSNLGNLHIQKGMIERSLELNKRCLGLSKDIGYKRAVAMSLNYIGESYHFLGDLDEAKKFYENSREVCQKMGDKRGLASAIGNIGDIHRKQGMLPQSLDEYNRCIEIYEDIGDLFETVHNETRLAEVYYLKGDYGQALEHAEKAFSLADDKRNKSVIAQSQRVIGKIKREKGEVDEALSYLKDSEELFSNLNDRPELNMARYEIAILYMERGDDKQGTELLKDVKDQFEEMGMESWITRCDEHLSG